MLRINGVEAKAANTRTGIDVITVVNPSAETNPPVNRVEMNRNIAFIPPTSSEK